MRHTALAFALMVLTATPALAQGRGRDKQGIPPGHLPPEGSCRVWYDGVPPGQQPPPTSCYEAERVASRSYRARVIYGDRSGRNAPVYRDGRSYPGGIWRDDERRYPDDDRRYPDTDGRRPNPDRGNRTGRAVPRDDRYPNTYPDARYPERRGEYSDRSEAYQRGYDDGVVKGREDVRDGDRYDPARHGWYRSADRGYNNRYGSRDGYREDYRRGFLAGYDSIRGGLRR